MHANAIRLTALAALMLAIAAGSPAAPAAPAGGILWEVPADLREPDMTLEHPRVFYTTEDIARLRRNLENSDAAWARRIRDEIVKTADALRWMSMSDDEIRAVVPPPGSLFMEGWFGCVCYCGAWMEPVGWDAPGKALCTRGHLLPDADHPDEGHGWRDEKGYLHFFTAHWNGFDLDSMSRALEPLAEAYIVTGDEKYAAKAATIIDAMATIYPTTTLASMDLVTGNIKELRDPSIRPENGGEGRFERSGYQVGRTLVWFVNAADLIWNSKAFNAPSPTNPGLSIRDNVTFNMFMDGGDYCNHHALNPTYVENIFNGSADFQKGQMAVGVMFNVDRFIDRTVDHPSGIRTYFRNAIDRDGNYFESAGLFAHGDKPIFEGIRDIYFGHFEMLRNLRTAEYPNGIDEWSDPRVARFYMNSRPRHAVAGRIPDYGDSQPDPENTDDSAIDMEAFDHASYIYGRTSNEGTRAKAAQAMSAIADAPAVDLLHNFWQRANIEDVAPLREPGKMAPVHPSNFQGGKGFFALRAPNGRQGLWLRYGPTLNHGQPDELAMMFYGDGRELSNDPGWWVTGPTFHYRNGFQLQTVAAVGVVVNEKSQLSAESAGGSLEFLANGGSISVAEASDASAYASQNVETYRRLNALVNHGDSAYIVDIFRVKGGETRDYSFHGLGKKMTVRGVELGAAEAGSVASPDYWWGDKIRGDGKIVGFEEEPFGYRPAPGTGYGFLGNPRRAVTGDAWTATWQEPGRLRLTMLPSPGREVIAATGPSVMGVDYILARDKGDKPSQFVAVIQPGESFSPETKVESLKVSGGGSGDFAPVAFQVIHPDGAVDTILSSADGKEFTAGEGEGDFTTDAAFAFVRSDERSVVEAHMVKGTTLKHGQLDLTAPAAQIEGRIVMAVAGDASLHVEIPSDLTLENLRGETVLIDADEYSHNSPYTIRSVGRYRDHKNRWSISLDPDSIRLGSGLIGDDITTPGILPNVMTLPYARNVTRVPIPYLTGKQVVSAKGASTLIKMVQNNQSTLEVESTDGFAPGDRLMVLDAKAGDRISIPLTASFMRGESR